MKTLIQAIASFVFIQMFGQAHAQTKDPCTPNIAAFVIEADGKCHRLVQQESKTMLEVLVVGTTLKTGDEIACSRGGRATMRFCRSRMDKKLTQNVYLVPNVPDVSSPGEGGSPALREAGGAKASNAPGGVLEKAYGGTAPGAPPAAGR